MKISYRWLARHVDLTGISPEDVVRDLTLSTAEVEGLERFLPHLSDVVVGFVKERAKHPDADKLSVCQVDVGGETLGIVCGANNVAAGQKVAVAKGGTKLPGDLTIKKSKIRGVESNGMICSERELGLGDEHAGIWVLPADAPIGVPVAKALGLEDWVIEIDNKSLTHRPDLWGHRGIAGEIAAMHRRALKPLELKLPATGNGKPLPVRVETPNCSRYLALCLDGVQSGRSPDWLRTLLVAVGQRPIELLVDLSNFVMLDLAQPNHLFDRNRLSPEGIVVRMARSGESMKTLDGVERKLTSEDMLICSGPEPVALAGIMGGEGSKVEGSTSALLLEVANFHYSTVRRTGQRLGLRTDASARFEKNLDPTLPLVAAAHLVNLLRKEQPNVTLSAPMTDAGVWQDPARTIELRGERVRTLLGVELDDAAIADILTRLGFGVTRAPNPISTAPSATKAGSAAMSGAAKPTNSGASSMSVKVPSARSTKDITIEQDLIEEVGRIHRYGNVPERRLVGEIAPPPRDDRRALVRALQDRLAGGARFHETLSYSFVSDELMHKLGLGEERFVSVVNPVADGFAKIRRNVLPSVLAALESNRRQREEVRLFEIGKGYQPEYANTKGEPREVHELVIAWAAPAPKKGARFDAARFAQLQALVEDLLHACGFERPTWSATAKETAPTWAHPAQCLAGRVSKDGDALVTLAALEPGLARELGLVGELASDVALAELSLDLLLRSPRRKSGYKSIPKFPLVKVDVAIAVALEQPASALVAGIEKSGKGLVDSVELFDVYSGPNLGPGQKSLAFHVVLRSDAKTLGEAEVHKFLERVERELASLGGLLRKM